MSRKSQLKASMLAASKRIGGAHLTLQARKVAVNNFVKILTTSGNQIKSAEQIGGRHIVAFITNRKAAGVSVGTLQNDMAHLREILHAMGKTSLADDPAYSNLALGISGRSRIGTNKPVTEIAIENFTSSAALLKRPSMAITFNLLRAIGLRRQEGVMADAETLLRWSHELDLHGRVHVIKGTKGGRPRYTAVPDIEAAQEAVKEAYQVAKEQGGFLITRANGKPTTLKSALSIFSSFCHHHGPSPHSARYAFAEERVFSYIESGRSVESALSETSCDLGHGPGRGRYVKSVYARPVAEKLKNIQRTESSG